MPDDLKSIKRKVYMSFFQDGLWDICLGLFVLGWGVGMLTDLAHLVGGWFVAIYFIVWALKRRLTYPRIGYVKLDERETRLKAGFALALGVVALAGVMVLLLFSLETRPQWLVEYFPLFFSGMLAIMAGLAGWWLGAGRFIFHAVLIFLAGAAHQWLGIRWPDAYIAAGGLIALIGIVIFVRFLKKYPVADREETDALP